MSHTPGPWHWHTQGPISAIRAATEAGCHTTIARVDNADDARLIAAAPELRKELREITGRYEAMCVLTRTTGRIADTSTARALLARVAG